MSMTPSGNRTSAAFGQLDDRLDRALTQARAVLLAERNPRGHWRGELSSSPLSTATAVAALSLSLRHAPHAEEADRWRSLIERGIEWLVPQQNADGGWGDTDRSRSNIATTMLVKAAVVMAGRERELDALVASADRYIAGQGGIEGLRKRYGSDKTFAVPILTCCALAGLVSWREVDPLPFEAAVLPQSWYRWVRLPVVSYAIPALVAIGQARYFHRSPRNPIAWLMRRLAVGRTTRVLRSVQPESGGYLEATPLTSFVLMSLESTGRHHHPVARSARRFLVDSVRSDGSWPIDTDLATWNTTLAVNSLASSGYDVAALDCLSWLLDCQVRSRHPYTGAAPGGWGWSDLSGSVPDADDTPGALLALRCFWEKLEVDSRRRAAVEEAVDSGLSWLLDLQNRDGGWPTFCRGWGKLPFDRSGADLTAHALRALVAWKDRVADRRYRRAVERGLSFLEMSQEPAGSWTPLWFGNQDEADEANRVYGTSKVLMALASLGRSDTSVCARGLEWLVGRQNEDGSWGGGPSVSRYAPRLGQGTIEETSLALEALARVPGSPSIEGPLERGADWLIGRVLDKSFVEPSPIGFYFARLWYYERLYPTTFAVAALGRLAARPT